MFDYKTLAYQEETYSVPNKGLKRFTHTEEQRAEFNLEKFNEFISEKLLMVGS